MNTNTVVSNHTNFGGQNIKSRKIVTRKYFDEEGRVVSEETTEEIEYAEPPKVLPQPYHDPYQLLRDRGWGTNPVVWSAVSGSYELAGKDTALDLD